MTVAVVTLDYLGSRMAESAYVQQLTRAAVDKARMMSLAITWRGGAPDPARIRALAQAAGARLTVIRRDGSVAADSEADASHMENHAHRAEVSEALAGRAGVSRRPSSTLNTDFLYVAVPAPWGAVRLATPLREIRGYVQDLRWRLMRYSVFALAPAILLAGIMARLFSRKLGAIIDYASTLATGNFRARLHSPGSDELDILGKQLNETGTKLQKLFEELQREHQALERMESIRRDFVINVSHELRTPLASIHGYTETLLDGALHDADHNTRFLQIIRQNAERLTRLTSDLLTLSRIELNTQRFQFAAYGLGSLLDDCCDSLRPVAGKKEITLRLDKPPASAEVFCDAEAFHQVMTNLLDNAIKYSPSGGEVEIRTRLVPAQGIRPEMAEVSVTDHGMGIPPADIPRLFERFYRVDKARSRELGGTGLGLAIVKHLVRSHGGEVRVESVLNQGSTFSFTLPTRDIGQPETRQLQSQFIKS